MTQISQVAQTLAQGIFDTSTTQLHVLGERVATNDGRAYRYVYNGGVAAVVGKLYQAAAQITNHQNLTPTATSAGATQVTVTLGATAATANQYAGGYVVITVTPGVGYQYRVSSHPAASSGGSLTLTLEDPIQVALTTSSRIDLVPSPYSAVIVNPTTATSAPIGVAVSAIPINNYGWMQVSGPATVLADGAITTGTNVIASNAVAGAVEPGADAADLQAWVGVALTGVADTEYGAIALNLS